MKKSSFIKKRIIIITMLLLAAFTACKKEDSRTITATLERYSSDSKAYIDSRYFACWSDGDMVSINGTPHAISINNDGTATIADVPTGELTAFYPAHRFKYDWIKFPMVQEYETDDLGHQLIDNPMAAYSAESNELRFRNLGALLEITLKPASTIMVKAIEVKGNDDQMLWGEATLAVDDGIPHLTSLINGGSSVVLHFDQSEEVTPDGKAFYIVVPAHAKFETFSISVLKSEGGIYTSTCKSKYIDQSIPRNHIGAITYNLDNDDSYQPSWMIKYTTTDESPITPNFSNCLSNADGHLLLDNALSSIEDSAFAECSNLVTISLPNSLTSIGNSAFEGCTSLSNISLPYRIRSIGNSAFKGCTSLSIISLPSDLVLIRSSAFENCISLSNISFPYYRSGIIENSAFKGCTSLTSITFPNSIAQIGNNAFEGCSNLSTAYCKRSSPPTLGDDAFLSCSPSLVIYVPMNVVDIYINNPLWSIYRNIIQGYSF